MIFGAKLDGLVTRNTAGSGRDAWGSLIPPRPLETVGGGRGQRQRMIVSFGWPFLLAGRGTNVIDREGGAHDYLLPTLIPRCDCLEKYLKHFALGVVARSRGLALTRIRTQSCLASLTPSFLVLDIFC